MSSGWKRRPTRIETPIAPTDSAVTIGLRIQYVGSKALHFPRALPGVPEPIPKSLLQDVRQDLKTLGLGSVLPKDGNAHFSALMSHTVEIVWPQPQAHQAQPLKASLWKQFENMKTEALTSRSVCCMMFYVLAGLMSSLNAHPPAERLQGFVCDPGFVDKTWASECRGAMALVRRAQEEDMLALLSAPQDGPSTSTISPSPRNARHPSDRPPPTGPRADRLRQPSRSTSLDAPSSPPRKRSPEPDRDWKVEEEIRELKVKVRRLQDSRDAAQARAREMRDELDATRERGANMRALSEMEIEVTMLKARARRAESREHQLNVWLKEVLADEWATADSPNLDGLLVLLGSKLADMRARAEQAEADFAQLDEECNNRAGALQLVDGDAKLVPALLEALMQIADATGVSMTLDSESTEKTCR